tara:strand:- start:410 stop:1186 length:777 start_codon:yes stop_codon:yes gene_type:complete
MRIIKQTREVGTSAGVLLPREWLNKQVVVQLINPDSKTIRKKVLNILIEEDLLQEVKGIYQIGSIARKEADEHSDIDILVITKETSRIIDEENYNLTLVTEEKIKKSLKENPIYYLPMIIEAKTIINSNLIEEYKKYKLTKKGVLTYVKSTRNSIKKGKEIIELDKKLKNKKTGDSVAYSLVLRIRGAYILDSIIKSKLWNKRKLMKIINNERVYNRYQAVREDKNSNRNHVTIDDAEELIKILEGMIKRLEKWAKEK